MISHESLDFDAAREERDWYAQSIANQVARGVTPDPDAVNHYRLAAAAVQASLGMGGLP